MNSRVPSTKTLTINKPNLGVHIAIFIEQFSIRVKRFNTVMTEASIIQKPVH